MSRQAANGLTPPCAACATDGTGIMPPAAAVPVAAAVLIAAAAASAVPVAAAAAPVAQGSCAMVGTSDGLLLTAPGFRKDNRHGLLRNWETGGRGVSRQAANGLTPPRAPVAAAVTGVGVMPSAAAAPVAAPVADAAPIAAPLVGGSCAKIGSFDLLFTALDCFTTSEGHGKSWGRKPRVQGGCPGDLTALMPACPAGPGVARSPVSPAVASAMASADVLRTDAASIAAVLGGADAAGTHVGPACNVVAGTTADGGGVFPPCSRQESLAASVGPCSAAAVVCCRSESCDAVLAASFAPAPGDEGGSDCPWRSRSNNPVSGLKTGTRMARDPNATYGNINGSCFAGT